MFGLTRGATSAHIARAALEAIAFQNVDVLAAMQKDAGITLQELRVDGGATANNLLMQIQADVLGVPVVRPKVLETTALGAGYLAGLAVGYWKDAADVAANWRVDRVFEPAMARDRVQAWTAGWNKAVERAKSWAARRRARDRAAPVGISAMRYGSGSGGGSESAATWSTASVMMPSTPHAARLAMRSGSFGV